MTIRSDIPLPHKTHCSGEIESKIFQSKTDNSTHFSNLIHLQRYVYIWVDLIYIYWCQLLILWYVSNNRLFLSFQCSYYPPCKSSKIANDKSVSNYQQRFGVIGKSFSCLFNPVNPRQVIRTRRFELKHVLHGTVWSSIICLASSSALILIIKRRGCIYV